MKVRSTRRWSALGAAAMLTVTLAACANSGGSGSNAKADEADIARYQEALDKWYDGTYTEPAGPAVEAPDDKDVWFVSVGLGIEYSVRGVDAAKEAAESLGWSVHVFDAKFDPNQMLTGVQQAVVANADAIVLQVIDCDTVKNGIQQAIDAGIPVVGIESKDCDPGLFSHVVTYAGKQSFHDSTLDFGRAQAAWVVAKTEGEAKVVLNTGTDSETTRVSAEGSREVFEDCKTCEIVDDATWVTGDLGPALQEKIQQVMIKNPDANAFIPSYDAIVTQYGGAQALSATGRLQDLTVGGGEGTVAGIEQIRNGKGMQMCAGQSVEWESYAAFDAVARLLAKADPTEVDTGMGIQVCDKDHNLPEEGEPYTPPVDFVAAYLKLWGKS